MDKIAGALDALQKIYGKGYALAGFLPVVSVLIVSWILGCWLSTTVRDLSDYFLRSNMTRQVTLSTLGLLVLSLIAFVFWLLNPWFRRVLEGRFWPSSIQDHLAHRHRQQLSVLDERIQRLMSQAGRYRRAIALWPNALVAASTGIGNALIDETLIDDYQTLKRRFGGFDPVPFADVDAFYARLVTALGATSTAAVPRLRQVRDDVLKSLARAGQTSAERAMYRSLTNRTMQYPTRELNVGPTRLANIQEAQRDYLAENYGIDVTLFWPDLQKIAAQDEKFTATLENAKNRLDFSIAMTAAWALFTIGWIGINIASPVDPWVYVAVSVSGALVTLAFHGLVSISYVTFTEAVRTAVELFRFQLMTALHLPLPPNDEVERQTWLNVARRLETPVRIPVVYQHDA